MVRFNRRNWRLKFERLLNPQAKAISVTFISPSASSRQARPTRNSLIITNGGRVFNTTGWIGSNTMANANSVLVTGFGSIWTNKGNVFVGNGGTGNRLTIADSGLVFANNAFVGDGAGIATLNLLGGKISLANLLTIQNNATLSGNGTVSGSVLVNGTVQADSGGWLTFLNAVTNNAVLRILNGAVLESYGPVINNGVIEIIDGNTNFHSTFINNGFVLTAGPDADGDGMSNLQELQAGTCPTNSVSCLRVTGVTRDSNDVCITWTAVGGKSYVVQTNSVPGSGFADFSPVIYVPGVGESITNYVHTGGATNGTALFYRVRLGP